MRSDIAPGGTFPDYELPDHESVPRKLSELQGRTPATSPTSMDGTGGRTASGFPT
jgi:hypothetical protein